VRPNLTLADSARIGGRLTYASSADATISAAAQVAGGITPKLLPSAPTQAAPFPGLAQLQRLAGLLLVGLLLLWVVPTWTRRMADTVEAKPLPSLGWGVVAFIAFVAMVFIVLITTIVLAVIFGYLTLGGLVAMIVSLGLLVNAALVVGYIAFVAYMAAIVVGYMAGGWLLRKVQPAWAENPFGPLVLGLILYVILTTIPWLGVLVGLLVTLLGLGALWQWGRALFARTGPRPTPLGGLQPA
jgi:hypothetical protein